MKHFVFVKINEFITGGRWYRPREIYIVKKHHIIENDRYRLPKNSFNDRAFEHREDKVRHRYANDGLAISDLECTRIDPPSDFTNKDYIDIIDLSDDV